MYGFFCAIWYQMSKKASQRFFRIPLKELASTQKKHVRKEHFFNCHVAQHSNELSYYVGSIMPFGKCFQENIRLSATQIYIFLTQKLDISLDFICFILVLLWLNF